MGNHPLISAWDWISGHNRSNSKEAKHEPAATTFHSTRYPPEPPASHRVPFAKQTCVSCGSTASVGQQQMPPHLCFRFLDNSNYETALRPPKRLKQRRLNSRARKGRLNSTARKKRFNSTVGKNRFNSTVRKDRPHQQRAPQNISPISIAYSSVSGVSGLPTYEMSRRQFFPISPLYLPHPPDGSLNGDAETGPPSWSPAYDRTRGAERDEKHEDTAADIDHAFAEVSMALANLTQITDVAQGRQDGVAAINYSAAASPSPRSQAPDGSCRKSDTSSYTSSYSSSLTASPSNHKRTLPNSPTTWVSMITMLSPEQDAVGVSPDDFTRGTYSKADAAISTTYTSSYTSTTITSAVEHVSPPTSVAYHPQLQTTLMSPVGLWTRLRASQRVTQPPVASHQDRSMVQEVEKEKLGKGDTETELSQSPLLREVHSPILREVRDLKTHVARDKPTASVGGPDDWFDQFGFVTYGRLLESRFSLKAKSRPPSQTGGNPPSTSRLSEKYLPMLASRDHLTRAQLRGTMFRNAEYKVSLVGWNERRPALSPVRAAVELSSPVPGFPPNKEDYRFTKTVRRRGSSPGWGMSCNLNDDLCQFLAGNPAGRYSLGADRKQ